jgi:hypothetical protein
MRQFFLFLALFPLLAQAEPYQIDQHWEGRGTLISTGFTRPVEISMAVHLQITPASILIEDCWKNADLHLSQCFTSRYELDEAQSIYKDGHKIGDVYPGHVITFIGNPQVSEQMVFDIRGTGQLNIQYNFAAFDGVYSVRQGELSPLPATK